VPNASLPGVPALHIVEHRLALRGREPIQCLGKGLAQHTLKHPLLGSRRRVDRLLQHFRTAKVLLRARSASASRVQIGVERDLAEPGLDALQFAQARCGGKGTDESLLGQVFGVLAVSRQPQKVSVDGSMALAMPPLKVLEA
jgi:hypothetical protein